MADLANNNTNLFTSVLRWVTDRFTAVEEEEAFPVDWRTILAYQPYYAAFAAYTDNHRHRHLGEAVLGDTTFDRLVGKMAVHERRNFALFIIYQMSRERQREDHAYYSTVYRMLQRLLRFRLWDDEHEMIYLGRAFLAFVPFDYRHLIYWPLGDYLTQVEHFRRARRGRSVGAVHSFLGSQEELYRTLLAELEPHELFGYTKELTRWRDQLQGLLAPLTDGTARPRLRAA